ncbi:hypothetical protein, partial [Escherichia coli]|uniref:hypothetical protein n=1 Tax=Escherichia coli TaxID=562 RepID=UPI0025424B1E
LTMLVAMWTYTFFTWCLMFSRPLSGNLSTTYLVVAESVNVPVTPREERVRIVFENDERLGDLPHGQRGVFVRVFGHAVGH